MGATLAHQAALGVGASGPLPRLKNRVRRKPRFGWPHFDQKQPP